MPAKSRKRIKRTPSPICESESGSESDYEHTPGSRDSSASSMRSRDAPILRATKGLLSLPPELIHHILSPFSEIRTEHILGCTNYINDSIPEDFLTRFSALRALSQLSRLSRSIFLPLLWERFQACLAPDSGWTWESENYIGGMLERKCRGMLECQHLWPYVKIVTIPVCWPQWSRSAETLSLLAQLLEVLPNAHKLEVLRTGWLVPRDLETCFRGKIFPSVRAVVLPTRAHEILRCCPQVREVTCNEGDGEQLVGALVHTGCSKLEVLRGIAAQPTLMRRLAKAKPPLKCIRIEGGSGRNLSKTEKAISALAAFRSLNIIEIDCAHAEENDLDRTVKFASEVLRKRTKEIPVSKNWNLRITTRNNRSAGPGSTNPEPKLVRVLRYQPRLSFFYDPTPAPNPTRIDVFAVGD